jgi:hypothetical protein
MKERTATYWLTPVGKMPGLTPKEWLELWLRRGYWGLFRGNRSRQQMQPGDWVAFHASPAGVVAFARIEGSATTLVATSDWPAGGTTFLETFRLPLSNVTWLERPVEIPAVLDQLDLFAGKRRRAIAFWGWAVNSTRRVSPKDFATLVQTQTEAAATRLSPAGR